MLPELSIILHRDQNQQMSIAKKFTLKGFKMINLALNINFYVHSTKNTFNNHLNIW